jgi:hypothetical protein
MRATRRILGIAWLGFLALAGGCGKEQSPETVLTGTPPETSSPAPTPTIDPARLMKPGPGQAPLPVPIIGPPLETTYLPGPSPAETRYRPQGSAAGDLQVEDIWGLKK